MPKVSVVKKKRLQIENKMCILQEKLEILREECPHQDLTYKYGGSSGNYDRYDDSYWIDWSCNDCGKRWVTSQDNSYHLTSVVYPHAVRIR